MSRAKTTVCSLGVDTQLFREPTDDAARQSREKLRGELGFGPSEIVCVYTGRFSGDKDPVCLARAVDRLVQDGRPFRALFVGNGTAEQIAAISACRGSVVHGFVPVRDLPPYYWASDVGVWPKQESTSQLDAAACGLPLVVSDRIGTPERVDGNGLLYREGDSDDLAAQLRTLEDGPLRARMGAAGSAKVRERFSWIRIAKERVTDYERALGR
jgi:glycosyltransferase involved in cell wall biosynthesis